jgi:serine/threonine-protein kinase
VKRALQVAFLVLTLAAIGQGLWQHSRLPERVMSHFDGAGRANGWMTRDAFLGWQVGTLGLLALLFEGIVLLQARLPREFVNIPHRDYWLAPGRRAATDTWISALVLLPGCLVMLFFMALFHQVYRVNVDGTRELTPNPAWLAAALVLAVLAVAAVTVARFARKPAD